METYKKKYEEAMLRMNKWVEGSEIIDPKEVAEFVFPELKASEDERTRKELLEYLKLKLKCSPLTDKQTELINKGVAWLEKQGKVKHTCSNCKTFQDLHQNCPYSPIYQCTDLAEAHKHLDDETNCEFWLEKQGEQKPIDKVEPKFKVGDTIRPKGSMAEYTIKNIYGGCYHGKGWGLFIGYDEDYELVEQKPAWSEEDEKMLQKTLSTIRYALSIPIDKEDEPGFVGSSTISWLKSLKERIAQSYWKPTEEQLTALNNAIEWCVDTDEDKPLLISLYKALMGGRELKNNKKTHQ